MNSQSSDQTSKVFVPSLRKARREGWLFVSVAIGLPAIALTLSTEARRNWPALAFAAALLFAFAAYKLLAGRRALAIDDLVLDPDGFQAPLIFRNKVPWSSCREVRNLFTEKGGNLLGFQIEGADDYAPRWSASKRYILAVSNPPEWRLPIDGFDEDADSVIAAVRRYAPAEPTSGLSTARRW